MSKVTIDSEKIAEIRNALQIITGDAEVISYSSFRECDNRARDIVEQVKRIDKLLPQVEFEKEDIRC